MSQVGTYGGEFHFELIVAAQDVKMSGDSRPARGIAKEVTDDPHQFLLTVVMSGDVLACDIGDKGLIPVPVSIQDQAHLLLLLVISVVLCSQKDPKLERHVEARQVRSRIKLCAAYVMYPVPAFRNNPEDFVYPRLARILNFQGTARYKSAVVDAKYDNAKEWLIVSIERTVDENAVRSTKLGVRHRNFLRHAG